MSSAGLLTLLIFKMFTEVAWHSKRYNGRGTGLYECNSIITRTH